MTFNPTISLYNGVKDTKGTALTVAEAINTIASDELSNQIHEITHEADEKKRTAKKTKLPAVTWSGRFSKRGANQLLQHTGLLCLDFDKLKEVTATKLKLTRDADHFIYAVFISPSGNGLKVICRINISTNDVSGKTNQLESIQKQHGEYFGRLALFFHTNYGLVADESGKDVSRLCFLSWDKSIYVNENAKPFTYREEAPREAKGFKKLVERTSAKTKATTPDLPSNDFEYLRNFTDKKFSYSEGKYNSYVNAFIMNAKQRGIEESETLSYCEANFPDYTEFHGHKSIKNIVASVYASAKIEFGKYKPKGKTQSASKSNPSTPASTPKPGAASEYNEQILFWYVTEKPDKDTGEMKEEHKFDHDGLTFFLANNGFRKIKLGEKGYQFIRLSNGLLEAVEPDDINHFLMAYLHKDVKPGSNGTYDIDNVRDELHEVRRMYKRGVNTYTKTAMYASLPELKPSFLRDTEKTTYLYFENGYVEVNAENRTLHSYYELEANIWSKQRKQFKLSLLDKKEIEASVIYQFLNCAIIGEGTDDDKDPKRLQSMITTIGYVLDTHKDPTNTKAPVFQDRKINGGEDANGGSGKTLTAHMIGKMINSCLIDGKAFNFDSPYPYDTFRVDHKLIVYNDVNRKFPFDKLFHKITEDFQFDRRYVDAITIPQEDAPKHLVITNYSLSGSTSSFRRRQHIIEFSDYFDDEYTPKDEFGHRFFIDWDESEWNRFYNFMIFCVQEYKKYGLVPFPAMNVQMNRLITEAGEEFVDWMDAMLLGDPAATPPIEAQLGLDKPLSKDEMFRGFINDVKRWEKLTKTNMFSGWVKQWADMRGYIFDKSKSGRNYFWTFTKKKDKA